MANFNVGKFNTLKVDNSSTNKTTNSGNDKDKLRKRFMLIGIIIIGGVILLMLILFVASLFTNKTYSYRELETVLKNSAINYYRDNDSNLPTTEDQTTEIDSSTLISAEYMEDFSEMVEEGTICSGRVVVSKNGKNYNYTPYLDCGEKYVTKRFYEVITDTKNVVTSGYGLYSVNNNFVYRGEEVNNYVQLDKQVWRIVKVDTNNKISLILSDKSSAGIAWDDRYNTDRKFNAGVNNYRSSRIYESLDDLYKNNDEYEGILSAEDRKHLVKNDICVGKMDANSDILDNSIECSDIFSDQRMGLLTVSDYAIASVDANCTTATSKSCQNYNYLNASFKWWLLTASNTSSASVFYVDMSGIVKESSGSSYNYIRPVIYLDENTLFASGKGTEKSPYKIR